AKEFHPTKNTPLTVYNVTAGTSRKIHWVCSKGHEWRVSANSRISYNSGCPKCGKMKAWETRRENQALTKDKETLCDLQ
ncbi:MAG: zinc-ribbon domain-containing protein, partial [Patescibacteria group bacterium]